MSSRQKSLKIGFLADPLSQFHPTNETTSFFMKEVCRRYGSCFHFEAADLIFQKNSLWAAVQEIECQKKRGTFVFTVKSKKTLALTQLDAVFLRKDPPVDVYYIDHLSLLEVIASQTLLINHPSGIKLSNEKLFPLHFPEVFPKTLVSHQMESLQDFVKKEKTAILKPLNMAGGRGVLKVRSDDPSLASIIEVLTQNGARYIMAQEYLPQAQKGDKRVLLLDGEILGAFLRVPSKKDFRGNLHSGARLKKASLSSHEKRLLALVQPRLRELGLFFVGVDIIGDFITEINTTSPMGIGEINQLTSSQKEKNVIDWLEKTCAAFSRDSSLFRV